MKSVQNHRIHPSPAKRGRVLVVDDDAGILEAFQAMLENEGYTVQTTPDAEKVFGLTDGEHPDVILLDVLLSGADGREICKHLKSQEETKNIPVIMISAHPTVKATIQETRADDFLSKPFEMDELLTKVAKYAK